MISSSNGQDAAKAAVVYREIKRRITELVFVPGDKLSEARIAQELGCGRSPVRTAFTKLQSEGWIEISPSSGTFVRGLSQTEITEILEARILLESYLAGRAARLMNDSELARLRKTFSSFGKRVSADQLEAYLELDLQFHLTIYNAAANKLLSDVLLNLIDKVKWIRRASASHPVRIRHALGEIHKVLDALESRNEEAAAEAMRAHIENTLEFRKSGQRSAGQRSASNRTPP